ncbi:nucleotide sugar dehydrogenase [Roseiflexus sp.]|uniref:nucleotide sugar dehydrogenase n=1 Tax=Roseiflexus sp. TaxID=2562120 RepID=UPI00398AB3DC
MSSVSSRERLLQRIADRSVHVGIIGVGYVGLPLAAVFGAAGLRVTGIDASAERVAAINAGRSYIDDVPTDVVAHLRAQDLLDATTDFDVLAELDAISICVPTPLRKTRDPDISAIMSVTEQIAQRLRPGQLIVLESTTYPGTTREVILPRLESSGLKVGIDYFLAFSPERVDPGRTDWTTRNTPKVMGGVTPACLETARALYETAIERVVPVSSPEVAEMVKLLENTFRAVNIGLVNEVLLMCDKLGLDVWEVIDAAATKPFGFMKFTPGPGLGGHCIPIDPLYLSWKLKTLNYTARFIDLASEVNTDMPRYWVQKVQDTLNDAGRAVKGSRVLVLGVAYKRDVDDVRESPALDIIHLLHEKGALVTYHDPLVPEVQVEHLSLHSEPDLEAAIEAADCVIIVTDHSAYDWRRVAQRAGRVVDTRGVLRHLANDQK